MLGHCYKGWVYIRLLEFPWHLFFVFFSQTVRVRPGLKTWPLWKMFGDAQYVVRDDLNRILFDGVSDINSRCQITYVLWLEWEVRFKQPSSPLIEEGLKLPKVSEVAATRSPAGNVTCLLSTLFIQSAIFPDEKANNCASRAAHQTI